MRKTPNTACVFFNASVILAGLASPRGGSAKLLNFVKNKKINGVISEIILDEIVRRAGKIRLKPEFAEKAVRLIFLNIVQAPKSGTVDSYANIVKDQGDCHVLASAEEVKADFLVSLDKKHILSLKSAVNKFKICTPKELIQTLASEFHL